MTLGGRRLQELNKKLQSMYGRPFRALPGVFGVEFTDGEDGEFFVTFRYRPKGGGQPCVFRKHFSKQYVFGTSCNSPNHEDWQYRMRVCRFGQDTITDVLAAMGVL